MTVGPYEAQLITASIFAIPGIVLVLVAIFTGQFSRKNEQTKYAVFFDEQPEDFWEQDERYRSSNRPTPRKGGDS
jgi:hypothetical protein